MDSRQLRLQIRTLCPCVTGALGRVAEWYAQTDGESAARMSMREAARRCGVSEATVARFAHLLGFSSFSQFRRTLAAPENGSAFRRGIYDDAVPDETPARLCARIAQNNTQAMEKTAQTLDVAALERAVDALVCARRIVAVAQGRSAIAAESFASRFQSLGYAVCVCNDPSLAYINVSLLEKGDVLLVFSMSGMVRSNVVCAVTAKKSGATVIHVTGSAHSLVAAQADILLLVQAETPHVHDHSFSTVLFMMTADCLFMGVYARLPEQRRRMLTAYRTLRVPDGNT